MTNHRFVNNTFLELKEANRSPIFGYEDLPLLTLEEAVEKIIPHISRLMDYVAIAKKNCYQNSTLLTWDESAAIYLYSMNTSFFSCLNKALRDENRQALKPWFAFLKLFLIALEKLPSTKATVWRGVNYDDTLSFVDDDVHIWWGVNSCSIALNIVQRFIDEKGTLFAIDALHGKDISAFSAMPEEQEVVLMPGTRVRRRCESFNFNERFFILHLEEINLQSELQSESSYLIELVKNKYQQNSRIERLMNPAKSFPIEQSYINLVIVRAKDQYDIEKQLGETQHTNDIMGTFEEIYGSKTTINVEDIFNTCKKQEKQVLVFGRAGIGKSTFCRYIAYQWAKGSYWPQYELLALIPLRRLTVNRYPPSKTYSLIDLIKKEIFSYDLSEKDERLLQKQLDTNKTLWILDGYDEIIQNVPPHLECLFEQLLQTPHHIITSRPYMNTLSYDVQMEITGFTDKNIVEYVQQFFNQIQDELDDALVKSQRLVSFLRSSSSIWGVAHIPVNLELICSVWSNEDWSDIEQLTITTLYTMMTEWLCRRYLTPPNKPILQLFKDEIDQRCQKELAFLENLAFNAMDNNTIIIRPYLLKQALKEAKVSLQAHPNILNIGILKSFNKQGIGTRIETNKDHYFVHLSFQEYFAARYLINALKDCSTEKVTEFIKHRKYNQRSALIFTFAAGLVSDSDTKHCLDIFWNNIMVEPSDLVGIRQMQLVISCLEETSEKSILPRFTQLLRWIAKCIKYSFSMKIKSIRRHLSQSLQKAQSVVCQQTIIEELIDLLQYDDTLTKAEVLLLISDLALSNPSPDLITLITTSLSDTNETVRKNACKALGNMGEKAATHKVISMLVSAIEDKKGDVRANACKAIGNMSEKVATHEVLSKLVNALGDERGDVRANASEALANMAEKAATNEVLSKLVSVIEDEREDVRWGAIGTLGKMGEKAATNEVLNKLVTALWDESRDVSWIASVVLGMMGEKAAANEVLIKLVDALSNESSRDVRWTASEALQNMGEKAATNEVLSKLVSTLKDRSENVRAEACEVLGQMGEKAATNEVLSQLASALESQDQAVIVRASKALGKMGKKAVTDEVLSKLVNALGNQRWEVRSNAKELLEKIGEKVTINEVISKLVNALGDERQYVRSNACRALGMISEKVATNEVISKLVSTLRDDGEDVRAHACKALGKIGEKAATSEVLSKLVCVLGDKSKYVRRSAIVTLGKMGEKAATNEVLSKLVSTLEDEKEDVRAKVCAALGMMGEKTATNEVISKLVSALGDGSVNVRANACAALGMMGEKAATNEVISKLVSALENGNENVRANTTTALVIMSEKGATNEVISKLVSALENGNENVRANTTTALVMMSEKGATNEVINKLTSALGDKNARVRSAASVALGNMGEKAATNEVLSKLVSLLGDESALLRWNASVALGKMGVKAATSEVLSKLVCVLGDKSEYVRRSASVTLGKMGEKAATNEVLSKLVSTLEDERGDVRAKVCEILGKIGEKTATNEVLRMLVNALGDERGDVRVSATAALGNMGDKAVTIEVISKLVSTLGDKRVDVRANAIEILGKMGKKVATNEVLSMIVSVLGDERGDARVSANVVLGMMGEKAATNEVISKFVVLMNNATFYSFALPITVAKILNSLAVIRQLDPKIILELCLSEEGIECLKNISAQELLSLFFTTKNSDWLSVLTAFTLLNGVAVTATDNQIAIYNEKEPLYSVFPSLELRQQLIDAFTNQAKRLHLFFDIAAEVGYGT